MCDRYYFRLTLIIIITYNRPSKMINFEDCADAPVDYT